MNKLYLKYLSRLPKVELETTDAIHILNKIEQDKIKYVYRIALIQSAVLGAFGVIFYFLPIHLFPNLFPRILVTQFFNFSFELEYGQIIYGLVLMMLEIHFLVLVNLKAVNEMANITGFNKTKIVANKNEFLFKLGMDTKELGLNNYGIDPYQDVNTKLLFIFNFILKLKGFLANKLLQYIVKRLLGRYAIRYVVDYIGIPIYMVINAYGTYIVLNKTKVCIMGSNIIDNYIKRLKIKEISITEKEILYDTLQLIAMSKRDYHQNHFLLTQALFNHFNISPKKKHLFTSDYYSNLNNASQDIKNLCRDLIVFGFILDGRVSRNEISKIKLLKQYSLIDFTYNEIKMMKNNFLRGRELFEY